MALPPATFFLSWWYSPNTKLGIYFNNFGLSNLNQPLNTRSLGTGVAGGLDYSNGMAASLEEDYHFENLITNHPVENTAAISDHIIPQPRIITITGLITSLQSTSLVGGLDFYQLGSATELLIGLYESNKGIALTTGLLYGASYLRVNNLAVQSLDIPRNNTYGRTSIKFTMVLKQLIITSVNGSVTSSSFSQAQEFDGVDIP